MTGHERIAWGHTLVGIGLLVRRLSAPSALLAVAALLLAGAAPSATGAGMAWVLAVPLAILAGARGLAVGLGALGWVTFPPEHRAMLSEIGSNFQLQR